MAVKRIEDRVAISGVVTAEELEALLEALEGLPEEARPKVDLAEVEELHGAAVQLLMAWDCEVTAFPKASPWTEWVRAALAPRSSPPT